MESGRTVSREQTDTFRFNLGKEGEKHGRGRRSYSIG